VRQLYSGEGIRNARKAHHLTQEQLAKALNVSKSTIANYENGKTIPSMETVIKLSIIFGITTDEVLALMNPQDEIDISVNGIKVQ
jgi:transcriptional regulator with XRE-family HTH domain